MLPSRCLCRPVRHMATHSLFRSFLHFATLHHFNHPALQIPQRRARRSVHTPRLSAAETSISSLTYCSTIWVPRLPTTLFRVMRDRMNFEQRLCGELGSDSFFSTTDVPAIYLSPSKTMSRDVFPMMATILQKIGDRTLTDLRKQTLLWSVSKSSPKATNRRFSISCDRSRNQIKALVDESQRSRKHEVSMAHILAGALSLAGPLQQVSSSDSQVFCCFL